MADEPRPQRRLAPTPPRMKKAELLRRDKASLTLSRGELEHLARLAAAGRVLLNDNRPVPARFRATLSRLGIHAVGL
jgi:protein tyrosine/serine phosphatase